MHMYAKKLTLFSRVARSLVISAFCFFASAFSFSFSCGEKKYPQTLQYYGKGRHTNTHIWRPITNYLPWLTLWHSFHLLSAGRSASFFLPPKEKAYQWHPPSLWQNQHSASLPTKHSSSPISNKCDVYNFKMNGIWKAVPVLILSLDWLFLVECAVPLLAVLARCPAALVDWNTSAQAREWKKKTL